MAEQDRAPRSEKLCECGCGEFTNVVTKANPRLGFKIGDARRFVYGHSSGVKRSRSHRSHNGQQWACSTPEYLKAWRERNRRGCKIARIKYCFKISRQRAEELLDASEGPCPACGSKDEFRNL